MNIPLTAFAEQEALLGLIEPAFDYVASLETDIDTNLQRAEALRQAILKKAFAGELVPQDPADEPAAALLARLRAERAATTFTKPARRAKAGPTKREKALLNEAQANYDANPSAGTPWRDVEARLRRKP